MQGKDFLVTKARRPWFLVEAKAGNTSLAPSLGRMQKAIGASPAFQVVANLPFVDGDPFTRTAPVIVPPRTNCPDGDSLPRRRRNRVCWFPFSHEQKTWLLTCTTLSGR